MSSVNNIEKGRVINSINVVADAVRNCKEISLAEIFNMPEFEFLSYYLSTNEKETVIFVAIYVSYYNFLNVGLNEIAKFFSCEPFDILLEHVTLESLVNKYLVIREKGYSSSSTDAAFIGDIYRINESLTHSILNDENVERYKLVSAVAKTKIKDEDLFDESDNEEINIINPSEIKVKKLFFDGQTDAAYKRLLNATKQGNFKRIQANLKKKKMPSGLTVILYGHPGTGKTEMAYQIAKATGREIFHVDISETKSCWYGDSEKAIKMIFDTYRHECVDYRLKPILLFNEADGVFGMRKDVNSGNVTQTENAMQNILLEELEHFDGILIATTNMTGNLDKAFERRFLYKVKFGKPSVEVKRKIWLSKLPQLSSSDAQYLAETYDFSGGEIDNIVRKVVLNEIIGDADKSLLDTVVDMCDHERIENEESYLPKVGFRV